MSTPATPQELAVITDDLRALDLSTAPEHVRGEVTFAVATLMMAHWHWERTTDEPASSAMTDEPACDHDASMAGGWCPRCGPIPDEPATSLPTGESAMDRECVCERPDHWPGCPVRSLQEAREWLHDHVYGEPLSSAATDAGVRGLIERHYLGGWDAFVADGLAS